MDGTDPRPIAVRHAASPTRGAFVMAEHLLVIPLCPFAKSMFERDASIRDVLA